MEHSSNLDNAMMPPSAGADGVVFAQIERCQNENSADKLEEYVKLAISVLDKLREPLRNAKDNMDASRFLNAVEKLKSQQQVIRTIIGVVGNTGSGKSSVINAVLDEEMLVPTNCMRACTAVITELSYNYSDNPDLLYRAEVEFISFEDWKTELTQLYADLIDSKGEVVKESSNSETEAGVAWAKIKAVYPQHTKEMLTKTTPDALVNLPKLRAVLGGTRSVFDSTAPGFYAKMQKFIDSQEKEGHKRKKGEKKPMEFWPLIKVVRIFTKAEALSTGAVIVDLPGVHDSNAARAAVADRYMEKCTGLWIVAPITRAVDDKTAQNLLGQSFKQQLKYDGMYSNVTFICSKTDDISITEAVQSLGLEEEIEARQIHIQLIESELAAKDLSMQGIINQYGELEAKKKDIQEQIDHLQELADGMMEGTTPATPSIGSQKRRNSTRQTSSRKRKTLLSMTAIQDSSSSSEGDDEDEAFAEEDTAADSSEKELLSKEQIRSELERLRGEKAALEMTVEDLETQFRATKKLCRHQKKELVLLHTGLKSVCIQERNKYAKNAIQHDWARGIKEMDQEAAMLENDELFDPENDIRDYDQIAAALPVFCVSSRAFQKKKKRLAKDDPIEGFCTEDETEVPQLQAHVKHLTEAGRATNSKQLLEEFGHILNSLNLWSKDHSAEVQLGDGEKRDQIDKLLADLSTSCENLNRTADTTVEVCRGIISKHIYDKFDASVEAAAQNAVLTAEKWFETKDYGGLPCNTFKATCRRAGSFGGKLGYRNLNEELLAPLKKSLVHSWERVFTRRMPQALDKFPGVCKLLLEHFHKVVTDRIRSKTSAASIFSLEVQLRKHINDITNVVQSFQLSMVALHREANRELTPTIAKAMNEAYLDSLKEIGNGCFSRMKVNMVAYVSTNRYSMFREATEGVRIKLNDLCTKLQFELLNKIKDIIAEMTSEYQHVIIGTDLAEVSKIARDEISAILSETDSLFQVPDTRDEPIVLIKSEDEIIA